MNNYSYNFLLGELEKYVQAGDFLESEELKVLENLKIAISGKVFFNWVVSSAKFSPFIGYSKHLLKETVNKIVQTFTKYNINILIVFEGITSYSENRDSLMTNNALIKEAWWRVYIREIQAANDLLANSISKLFLTEEELLPVLNSLNVEYIYAPYNCNA